MLTCLQVRDLAIIEHLEVELGPGFNVVTGETGAGKSILVDALELVLGARARSELVRSGADRAEVEALFDLGSAPEAVIEALREAGDEGEELVLRRVVQAGGRTRAWLNGRLATSAELARLGHALVDISSQHQHHTLVDASTHLHFLDAYAGLDARREAVAAAHARCVEADRALTSAADRARDRAEREAVLRFTLDEIDAVGPRSGEEAELSEEHERLAHAQELAGATSRAESELYDADDAVCTRIDRVVSALGGASRIDPRIEAWIAQIESARAEIEDAALGLGRYARNAVHDPRRLAEVSERLAALRRLARRYGGGDLDAVVAFRTQVAAELDDLGDLEGRLEGLQADRDRALAALVAEARVLSAERRKAASLLGRDITRELGSLGMGDARVEVDVAHLDERADGPAADGARLSATGMDRVEFLIAPNRGEEPRPLRRVASGGELSRSLLAIKRVLAENGPVGLYVFDEVDSGVGGAIAEVIGRKIRQVSHHHQVVCITHLAQIAACADQHFHVSKAVEGDRTRSRIRRLTDDERVEEMARMMGGLVVTDATRAAARALLEHARIAREEG